MKMVIGVIAALSLAALAACQPSRPVKLVFPDQTYQHPGWTGEELEKNIAIRPIYGNVNTSTFLIRMKDKETPHFHDDHDLSVSILDGDGIIHFKDHAVPVTPGDVIFIPKGTYHWAENTGSAATVLFAVFSPAFSGKDKRAAQ